MGSTSAILTGQGLATFNGTSSYAGSLQNEINQAVEIASIPLNQLQTNISTLQGESSELSTLQNDFSAVQTAIQSLDSASGGNSLAASVSDNTVATATLNSTLAQGAGTYTLNVIDPGSSTSTLSEAGSTVTDPTVSSISTASSFTLAVNGTNYTINPAANTLDSLAQAINGANAGVSATLVNLGSPSSPDYRLAVQSNNLGADSVQLSAGSQNFLTTLSTGADAQYQVDGQPTPTPISSNSSTVTIAPGVSVNLLAAGQTTVTVAPDSSAGSSALSAFVTAYNAAEAELANNHGTAGGALTGQSIVDQLSQSLSSILNYSGGSGNVTSLTELGITFTDSGQLQFDQSTYDSIVASDPNDVAAFLGSATGGTGFLGTATNTLNGLTQASTGLFASTNQTFQTQINADNTQSAADTQSIETMQNNMVAQMVQADSLIESLQNQLTYFTTLFQDTQNASISGG